MKDNEFIKIVGLVVEGVMVWEYGWLFDELL